MRLFPEWYIARHLECHAQRDPERQTGNSVRAHPRQQPRPAARLCAPRLPLAQPDEARENNPGILDFQDAVYGPITYDLASLFKDAYIRWEEAEIIDWLIRYWEKARKAGLPVHNDFSEFYRDYEWMGVQRHLKVLGIFARLYHRDGKDGYLKDMPLVMSYLRAACARYIDLKPLLNLLDNWSRISRSKSFDS